MALGKIDFYPLKKQWGYETQFSDWLAEDGLSMIGDAIGLELCDAKREVSVGEYSADILAHEDGGERVVVIENQYNTANHDHLGKLVTYAAGLGAKVVVWVVEDVRVEAVSAIKWLNEISRDDVSFFLVQAKLLQIGGSPLAPQFVVVEKPDEWSRQAHSQADELSERQKARLSFWTELAAYLKSDSAFLRSFNLRKPSADHWMDFSCGSSTYHLAMTIKGKDLLGVEIYSPNDKEQFAKFESARAAIEKELGFKMDWQLLPDKKASRIYFATKLNWLDSTHRKECFVWLSEKAVALKKVFGQSA